MQTTHKLAIVFLLIGALALPTAVPFASAQLGIPGTVEIISAPPVTCGIQEDPIGAELDYGSLLPEQLSSEQQLTLVNTGTSGADVAVTGTAWMADDGTAYMDSSATHYSLTQDTSYDDMLALPNDSNQPLGQIDPDTELVSYWMLRTSTFPSEVDVDGDGVVDPFTGRLTQTVNFFAQC